MKNLRFDIPASVFVFLVALPLCLGIALGSKAPLFAGLVAGVVGGIVVGLVSKSSLSVSGPAAGLTTIVAAAITSLPSYEAFLLAVVMAGVFQLILGLLRLGFIGEFIPVSVIKGMLAAIGLTLILKQIPHLLGDDSDFEGDESFVQPDGENTFTELITAVQHMTPLALVIGLISLAILIFWDSKHMKSRSWIRYVPAPLVAVLAGVGINEWLNGAGSLHALAGGHLVNIPSASSAGEFITFLSFPDLHALNQPAVWVTALTLAAVASLESLLGIEAVDKLDPKKRTTPASRELVAQGVGNMASGLIGGLPVTSVVVRSSANVTAGAQSKASTIIHGVLLLLSVLFIPDLLSRIPLSSLAGVLIFVGFKLTKPSIFSDLYHKGISQFLPFVVTVVAILLTDLLKGIGIGFLVALYFIVRSNFRSAILLVRDGNNYFLRFRKEVSFLNKAILRKTLLEVEPGSALIIDATHADFIDNDIVDIVDDFIINAQAQNISVEFKKSNKPLPFKTEPQRDHEEL